MDNHDTPPAVATQHWLVLVRAAEKIGGMVVSLELHRDCCTETPEKTYEIAARYHRATGELIKLTFDLSHFACVKQLHPGDYVTPAATKSSTSFTRIRIPRMHGRPPH
jgi:sugar phosphate isomerase/epimerase